MYISNNDTRLETKVYLEHDNNMFSLTIMLYCYYIYTNKATTKWMTRFRIKSIYTWIIRTIH